MHPITFSPVYMERVWGGRELERVYGRSLPESGKPYGEAWEIVDREEAQSVVDHGPLAGKTLHQLWTNHRDEIFGADLPDSERFPILLKILDARDDLSIQVHPPTHLAERLGGEPKTEMWVIADCDPGAKLYVGLKNGVDRAAFENAIRNGSVADCVHAIEPHPGDSIFIPSGRLHAIGAGFLIHEIQQNSDTTYRVFDWNRHGLDGKPRELHVEPSLASIDFEDFEPQMDSPIGATLADCPYFKTERIDLAEGRELASQDTDRFAIFSILNGTFHAMDGRAFTRGRSLLLPKGAKPLIADTQSVVLRITLPTA
ncbi:MAG: type I phosphomannose isomerase catalytic subunit [Luteolibacter sp.]